MGLLIGEGHFGGDGKLPADHPAHARAPRGAVPLAAARFPRARLYGPYNHGGRRYYQWMARGAGLVEDVLPVVEAVLTDEIDAHVAERVREMKEQLRGLLRQHAG